MTYQDHEEQAARMLESANIFGDCHIGQVCYESAAMHLSAANDARRMTNLLLRLAGDMCIGDQGSVISG